MHCWKFSVFKKLRFIRQRANWVEGVQAGRGSRMEVTSLHIPHESPCVWVPSFKSRPIEFLPGYEIWRAGQTESSRLWQQCRQLEEGQRGRSKTVGFYVCLFSFRFWGFVFCSYTKQHVCPLIHIFKKCSLNSQDGHDSLQCCGNKLNTTTEKNEVTVLKFETGNCNSIAGWEKSSSLDFFNFLCTIPSSYTVQ